MLNNSFDYSNIAYANTKTKITLKTKKKLDELAKQVALWNQDSFYKKKNFSGHNKRMTLNSKPSILTIDEKSKSFRDNTIQKDVFKTPSKRRDNGLVKKKAAFFESLGTPQSGPSNKINYTPCINTRNMTPVIPVIQEKNILKDVINIFNVCKNEEVAPPRVPFNKINYTPYSKAEQFISITPNQTKEEVNMDDVYKNEEIMPNHFDNVNLTFSDEDILPPPPPDYSEESSFTNDESPIPILDNTIEITKQYLSKKTLMDNLEIKCDMDRSMSISHDIEDSLLKRFSSDSIDFEIPADENQHQAKKPRRSLSWSEDVHYINPSESEDEIEAEYIESNEEEKEIVSDEIEDIVSHESVDFVIDEVKSIVSDEISSSDISIPSYDNSVQTLDYQKEAEIKAMACLTNVQNILANPRNHLAGREHTVACVALVKSCLVQRSLAEKLQSQRNSACVIEGFLEMHKIILNVKEGFVLIDYENLAKTNRINDLQQLKKLYNIVLMVRSRGDTNIKSSMVYNIISKSEAYRLSLPHESVEWLEVFEYVKFNNLQPDFKFIFDLYCMEATPKKYIYTGNKKKNTPLKKLWYHCRSSDKLQSPDCSGRTLFFTNIGSFTVSAHGILKSNQPHSDILGVHADCPFNGKVEFTTKFSMDLVNECEGRLNVLSELNGVGTWTYYHCKLNSSNLLGWYTLNKDEPDLILPLSACLEAAKICKYTVCAKQNAFSIMLDPYVKLFGVPVNRLKSDDGITSRRFLAVANSDQESMHWCDSINLTRNALCRWADVLTPDN